MAKKRQRSNKLAVVFLIFSALLVIIFANIIPKIQIYIKSLEATALVSFPKDHASHPTFKSEWWYLNLLTRTTKNNGAGQKDTAHVLSFTRILGKNGLLSSKYDNSTNSFNQKTNTGGDLNVYLKNNRYLFVQYSNGNTYSILEEQPVGSDRKKSYKLTGKTDQIGSFDLVLKERTVPKVGFTTPLLWGGDTGSCRGKISVFSPDDTFYYSIPDLDISGTINDLDGTQRIVKAGKAWIDHQWFNSSPPREWKGHYWNSFHLSMSSDVYDPGPHHAVGVVQQIYNTGPKYKYWVKRNANGTNQCGQALNLAIKSYGSTNYPSSWSINLKNSGTLFLQFNGNPFSNNQIFTPPIGSKFFEPASYFTGTLNGKNFTGLGFFETHLTKPL